MLFGIADVRAFAAAKLRAGLKFGAVDETDGIEFVNAKDPAGNSIQISSRGIARRRQRGTASI
jgi:hypothetical protein